MTSTSEVRSRALAEVQRRKQQLEKVEDLLSAADEETLSLLREALSSDHDTAQETTQTPNVPVAPTQNRPDMLSSNGTVKRVSRGLLDGKVRGAVSQIDGQITVRNVYQRLSGDNFRFGPGNPHRAVGVVLRKLKKEGILRASEPHSGRKPVIYTKGKVM